jgi:hypothetical protein
MYSGEPQIMDLKMHRADSTSKEQMAEKVGEEKNMIEQTLVNHLSAIVAFLPRKEVVTVLMVLRRSNPDFFPSEDHKRSLLSCITWRNGKLAAMQPLTLNTLGTFVKYGKAIPWEITRTNLIWEDCQAAGNNGCTLTHSASGMQLLLPSSVCVETEPGNDGVCGTFVFDRCDLCNKQRRECMECCGTCDGFGTVSPVGESHKVCKGCMVYGQDNMCRGCGYECAGCGTVLPYIDGCWMCVGPPTGEDCHSDLGQRCLDCKGDIMYCSVCKNNYCAACNPTAFNLQTMSFICLCCRLRMTGT